MAEGDRGRVFFTFDQMRQAVEETKAALNQRLGEVVAQADEMSARIIGAEKAALEGYGRAGAARGVAGQGGAGQAPEIERAAAAMRRLNAVRQLGLELDRDMLAVIREQTQAYVAQTAVAERAQRAGIALPSTGPRYRPYGATAGQQLAQEEERARIAAWEARAGRPQIMAPAAPVLEPRPGIVVPRVGGAYEQLAGQRAEAEERRRILALQAEELRLDQERLAVQQQITDWMARGEMEARMQARRGRAVPTEVRQQYLAGPPGNEAWGPAEAGAMRYRMALAQSNVFSRDASLSNDALRASFTRLGIVENESSDALRRHGALTTEYLAALARGETTIGEFGYQLGATIGKFAGWTAAATATYGVIRLVGEFGKGAADASSGAEQLRRTIQGVDTAQAVKAIQDLSAGTNVPVKEAADAIFQYSRVFHTLDEATSAAHYGLAVLRLDNVSLADSVALSTGILQQWGKTAQDQEPIWNMLAAGQREYNARISQTTTILRGSQSAVRQAGGDLNQLVQIAVLGAQALPGQPGQIATALSRSATTYARQNLPVIQAQFGIGRGMNATNYNFTQLFEEAIRRSPALAPEGRQELARLLFDPRLAARVGAAYLTPRAAATLEAETSGRRAITPAGTRGALDEELRRQMGTFRDQMHSFTNEIQRAGAAFGASGVIDLFSHLITASTALGGVVRNVVESFDAVPGTGRQVIETIIALRLAMLALTRTRVGATLAEATGLSAFPGFGRGRDTLLRGELRAGTRSALDTVTADLARTQTRLLSTESEQNVTAAKRVAVNNELQALENRGLKGSQQHTRLVEEGNALNIRLVELETQQTRLEIERNAQLDVQAGLKAQALGLSKSPRAGGFTPAEERALNAEVSASSPAGRAGAGTPVSVQERMAAEKTRLAGVAAADAAAAKAAAAATAGASGALAGATIAGEAEAGALIVQDGEQMSFAGMQARLAAAGTAARATAGAAAVATTGMAARMGGLVAAMDPWLLALIGLPIVWGKFQDEMHKADAAAKGGQDIMVRQYPGTFPQQMRQYAQAYQQAQKQQQEHGLTGFLQSITPPKVLGFDFGVPFRLLTGQGITGPPPRPTGANPLSDAGRNIAALGARLGARFQSDAAGLAATSQGNRQLAQEAQRLETAMDDVIRTQFAGHPQKIALAIQSFNDWLGGMADAARLAHAHAAPTQLDFLAGMSGPGLQAWAKAYSARSNIFGLQGGDLSGAIGAAMVMAARFRTSSDPNELQGLSTAISSVSSAVNRQVTGLVNAAKAAASPQAAMADLGKATKGVQTARTQVNHWVELMRKTWGNIPGIMKAVNEVAGQINDDLDSQLANILSQQLSDIQTQSNLAVSQIGGFSPESDIARAQKTLQGLRRQHVTALKAGDWQKSADLQTQINNSARDISKQQFDNDQAIADANAKIAEARIAPTSPEAEIQRAKIQLQRAQQKLAADKAAGLGDKQYAEDYAAMLDAQNTVNTDIRNNADAVFAANQAIAVASIMGIGPGADLARARQSLTNAWGTLRRDQAEHKGQAQIGNDYANALNAQRAVNQQAQSNADGLFDSNQQLALSRITGITPAADLERAKQTLANAWGKLQRDQAEQKGQGQINQDYAAALDAQRALNQQIQSNAQQVASDAASLISARAALQESRTTDPVAQARDQLAADRKILATIKPADYKNYSEYLAAYTSQQAKIGEDTKNVTDQLVQTRMSTLQYELHTQQITGQQYISGLEALLKMHGLSKQEIQNIRSAIFDEAQSQAVNLNTADIKLPTTYEIRRAIAGTVRQGGRIPQNTGTVVNHTVTNNVNMQVLVDRNADMKAFAATLDNALKSNFTGQAQAAGLI